MNSDDHAPKPEKKKSYHSPKLETYGDITELTETAAGSGKQDGSGLYGFPTYSK